MRFSTLHVFVCLAAAAIASPTDMSVGSLQARDMWTSPARRDVFVKGDAIAKRESHEHELLARELEELADQEEAELEERNFEDLRARYFDALAKREWNEFESRDIVSYNGLSKRDPQFNIGSFITNLRTQIANGRFGANATANANTGTGNTGTGATTNANAFGGFSGLGGGASARISSALSRLGFNFRRGEIEDLVDEFNWLPAEDSLAISKRDPQFNIGSFISNLRTQIASGRFGANASVNANTGTGNTGTGANTNANAGLGGFAGLGGGLGGGASARISSALSRLGFNFRRGEFDEVPEPFHLETFVKAKRSEIV